MIRPNFKYSGVAFETIGFFVFLKSGRGGKGSLNFVKMEVENAPVFPVFKDWLTKGNKSLENLSVLNPQIQISDNSANSSFLGKGEVFVEILCSESSKRNTDFFIAHEDEKINANEKIKMNKLRILF